MGEFFEPDKERIWLLIDKCANYLIRNSDYPEEEDARRILYLTEKHTTEED